MRLAYSIFKKIRGITFNIEEFYKKDILFLSHKSTCNLTVEEIREYLRCFTELKIYFVSTHDRWISKVEILYKNQEK